MAVHEALDRFAALDPERARLAELRYFGGLTLEEVAGVSGESLATVKRHWTVARLWLHKELSQSGQAPASNRRPFLIEPTVLPPGRHYP